MRFVKLTGRPCEADEPMFYALDRRRCYAYKCLNTDMHRVQNLLGIDKGQHATAHGLRVLGCNMSKRDNGQDLTVAHGGWLSKAHERYARLCSDYLTRTLMHQACATSRLAKVCAVAQLHFQAHRGRRPPQSNLQSRLGRRTTKRRRTLTRLWGGAGRRWRTLTRRATWCSAERSKPAAESTLFGCRLRAS